MSAPRNTATATPATGQEEACARAWVALSAAHARISGELARALASACDLSINDFEILVRVQHAGRQGLRLGSLNGVVQLTQPSLSRAVARLEERGWLARAEAAGDRRGVLVTLTPAGRARVDAALADLVKHEQKLLNGLSATDRTTLADLLRVLLAPLDA